MSNKKKLDNVEKYQMQVKSKLRNTIIEGNHPNRTVKKNYKSLQCAR